MRELTVIKTQILEMFRYYNSIEDRLLIKNNVEDDASEASIVQHKKRKMI